MNRKGNSKQKKVEEVKEDVAVNGDPPKEPTVTLTLGPLECEIFLAGMREVTKKICDDNNLTLLNTAANMLLAATQACANIRQQKGYQPPTDEQKQPAQEEVK